VSKEIIDQDAFTMMHFDILLTRFICAMLLHAGSEPEFRQALILFKYWCNHSNNFIHDKPTKSAELLELESKRDQETVL